MCISQGIYYLESNAYYKDLMCLFVASAIFFLSPYSNRSNSVILQRQSQKSALLDLMIAELYYFSFAVSQTSSLRSVPPDQRLSHHYRRKTKLVLGHRCSCDREDRGGSVNISTSDTGQATAEPETRGNRRR